MKRENWELAIIDYPRIFYILNCNFKQQWPSLAFTSVPYMVMKIIGISTVFNDSQLLADYHWHFHAYPMTLSVYATYYCLNFENKRTRTHTHTHTHTHTPTHTHTYTHTLTHAHTRTHHTHARLRQFTVYYFNWTKYFKMCTRFSKMCVVPCISNHYIRIKIQEIFGTHGHKEQFYFCKVCSD